MINWMKYRYLYLVFSLLIIIPGLFSLFTYGLKLSVDFTGGSVITLSDSTVIHEKDITQKQADEIVAKLQKDNPDVKIASFETLGPAMGQETIKKTIYAILLASFLLLIHITHAFKQLKFGVCAILAMLHDSLILLGIFSLLGHFAGVEVDLLFVTAALTVLSFSVHDTIVVYDRIRELQKRQSNTPIYDLANQAVSETMIRSLNTPSLSSSCFWPWFFSVGKRPGFLPSPFLSVPSPVLILLPSPPYRFWLSGTKFATGGSSL